MTDSIYSPRNSTKKLRIGLAYNLRRVASSFEKGIDAEAEFDTPETVSALQNALTQLGHTVFPVEADSSFFANLHEKRLDLVFNIAEGSGGRSREALVPAALELLQIPYTGSDVTAIAICHDKVLAKSIVRQAGIPTPQFFVLKTGDEPVPAGMKYPLMIKPAAEGSSKGIHDNSVVHSEPELRSVAKSYVARYGHTVLAEDYLPGREFTVGLLSKPDAANSSDAPQVLPIMEICFTDPTQKFPVYSFEMKVNDVKVKCNVPAAIDEPLRARIAQVAADAFIALGIRDVARIDIRLDAQGSPQFIECNPLPGLAPNFSDLVVLARAAGLDYIDLIGRILAPAIARI